MSKNSCGRERREKGKVTEWTLSLERRKPGPGYGSWVWGGKAPFIY